MLNCDTFLKEKPEGQLKTYTIRRIRMSPSSPLSRNSSDKSRRPGFLTTHRVPLSQGRKGIRISQPSHPKSLLRSGRRNYKHLCWEAELQCCHCPSRLHTRDPRAELNPSHYAGTRRLTKRPVGGVAESPLTEPLDQPSGRELTELGDCGKKRFGQWGRRSTSCKVPEQDGGR